MIHDSDEAKRAFALELIKNPNNPFQAAMQLFPNDMGWCLRVSQQWPSDPVVLEEKEALLKQTDEMDFLPGKASLCRAIWERLSGAETGYVGNDDFVKLARLYADVRGMVPKQGAEVNVNVDNRPRVMIVKDMGSNDDWETKAEAQQRALLNVSTSRH